MVQSYNTREATYSTAVAQPSFNMDPLVKRFNATIAVFLLGGATATFAIQFSLDDPFNVSDANANWQTITGAPTNANGYVALATPVQRVRCNISALTGGTVLFQVLQGIG